MRSRDYNDLHRTTTDSLGHTIKVGDKVIGYWYSNKPQVYRVLKVCPKRVKLKVLYNNWKEFKNPKNLIKIKEDGIPED